MKKRAKLYLLSGIAILIAIGGILIYCASAWPFLFWKKVHIVMHDPAALQPQPTVDNFYLKCSIQLPRECVQTARPLGSILAESATMAITIAAPIDKPDPDFKTYVRQRRAKILSDKGPPTMVEEGLTTIDGHDAYAMTYHDVNPFRHGPETVREIYVNGPDSKIYYLYFACDDADWKAKSEILDSSISTFHFNTSHP